MTESAPNQSAHPDIVERVAGRYMRIECPGPLVSILTTLITCITVGFLVTVAVAVNIARPGTIGTPLFVGAFVSLGVVLFLVPRWIVLPRTRQRTRRVVGAAGDVPLEKRVTNLLPRIRGHFVDDALQEMIRQLVEDDRRNLTFSIETPETIERIEPLTVPFEARRLEDVASNPDDPTREFVPPGADLSRMLLRNVLLKGGWLLLVIFTVNFALAALDAWWRGSVTIALGAWGLGIAALLFLPVRSSTASGEQWLVVPGGLIWRKTRMWSAEWNVHVFDRRNSVLLVGRWSGKKWVLMVCDGEESGQAIGTREELMFALRSWLSPLSPPPAELLCDLT